MIFVRRKLASNIQLLNNPLLQTFNNVEDPFHSDITIFSQHLRFLYFEWEISMSRLYNIAICIEACTTLQFQAFSEYCFGTLHKNKLESGLAHVLHAFLGLYGFIYILTYYWKNKCILQSFSTFSKMKSYVLSFIYKYIQPSIIIIGVLHCCSTCKYLFNKSHIKYRRSASIYIYIINS